MPSDDQKPKPNCFEPFNFAYDYWDEEDQVMIPEDTASQIVLTDKEVDKLRVRGYEIGKRIGFGTYGSVYLGTHFKEPCAVKSIQATTRDALLELNALTHIKHHHIVQMYDLFLTNQKEVLIFMEMAHGGNLADYVAEKKSKHLSERESVYFYRQFGDAFRYMHSRGIAHQDVKLENVLLMDGEKMFCKVSDFGMAKLIYDSDGHRLYFTLGRGSFDYMSPETLAHYIEPYKTSFDPLPADVWSAGVMLYFMLNGKYPFWTPNRELQREDLIELFSTQLSWQYKFYNPNLSDEARQIIVWHMAIKPEERPTFEEILRLPWILMPRSR